VSGHSNLSLQYRKYPENRGFNKISYDTENPCVTPAYRRKLTTPVLPAYNAVTGAYDIA